MMGEILHIPEPGTNQSLTGVQSPCGLIEFEDRECAVSGIASVTQGNVETLIIRLGFRGFHIIVIV